MPFLFGDSANAFLVQVLFTSAIYSHLGVCLNIDRPNPHIDELFLIFKYNTKAELLLHFVVVVVAVNSSYGKACLF